MQKLMIILPGVHKLYFGLIKLLSKKFKVYYAFPKEQGSFFAKIVSEKFCEKVPLEIVNLISTKDGGGLLKFKNLQQTLNKINPNLIICRPVFQPYSFEVRKWVKKNKKHIVFLEETRLSYYLKYKVALLVYLWLISFFMRKEKIITITKDTENLFKRTGFQNVVYMPIQLLENNKSELIKSTHKTKNSLLYIGRLDGVKRVDKILRVLLRLKKKGLDFDFHIIGDGPDRHFLEDFSETNKIKAIFYGFVKNKNLKGIIKKIKPSYFILPSRNEPLGLVSVEAMSFGLIPIISRNAGSWSYYSKYSFLTEEELFKILKHIHNKSLKELNKEKEKVFEIFKLNHQANETVLKKALDILNY